MRVKLLPHDLMLTSIKYIFLIAAGFASTQDTLMAARDDAEPVLWHLERDGAKVYILGFSEAKDLSWLTATVKHAFQESREIWFETPHDDPSAPPPSKAPARSRPPDVTEHNLFEVLSPALSARILSAAQKYGVSRERLKHASPWQAYFILNGGYFAHQGAGMADVESFPDVVLARMARDEKKTIHSEFATDEDAQAHFVNMPLEEASERLEFLLDFLDDDQAGRLSDRYDWISGNTTTRAIDKMRAKWPALYKDEQVDRNGAWAKRIAQFLFDGGTYFVIIGLQHTLGPDSLPNKLRALGLQPQKL